MKLKSAMLKRVAVTLLMVLACSRAAQAADPATQPFWRGVDISLLPEIEQSGVTFKDDHRRGDAMAIFAANGVNCVRLRLFVQPNGLDGVVNDLSYMLALAKRAKAAGLQWVLDFHYSDTWADPGNQQTPATWRGQDLSVLSRTVEHYTADVIAACRKAGVLPNAVQVGNEITAGMLWPTAKFGKGQPAEPVFDRLCQLLTAGAKGVRAGAGDGPVPKIILHIHNGGTRGMPKWFFDHVIARKVPFDMIGVSYYPVYGETLTGLSANLNEMAIAYAKPVLVMETAAAWRDSPEWHVKKLAWEASREGQKRFLDDLFSVVRAVPRGLGGGVFYWYPESVPVQNPRVDGYHGGDWALFDAAGNALPGLCAFKKPG